jgi:hypothetical protein
MHGDHLSVFAAAAGSLYSLFIDVFALLLLHAASAAGLGVSDSTAA